MAIKKEELQKKLNERFAHDMLGWSDFRGQLTLHVRPERIVELLRFLRDDPATSFNMLTDLTCVDYLRAPDEMEIPSEERFAVVYHLSALGSGNRLRVKAYVAEDPCEIDSVVSVWMGANWPEREAYDMYGVVFNGHPDLRRLLTPDHFEGHPLRKDYPLKGRGERDNFPKYSATSAE